MLEGLLLVQALAAASPASPTVGQAADRDRLETCIAAVDKDAEAGYETAWQWIAEAHVREAYVCAAISDLARNKADLAARQFESLSLDAPDDRDRATMLARAGNAWLVARDAGRASQAFDRALQLTPSDADLLIDRARARSMSRQWGPAEADLSSALDARPNDALALRLRAEARLQQSAFELAEKDARDAAALEPKSVEALLTLGRARDAKRTGKPPAE
jgi:predicted Zn-dependent protease